MRFAGNFHPEWGYLAPAPNFMRTARVVVVATAIGATAGAAVVLSLIDRPASASLADANKTLVVVHSLVQPAEAAAPAAPTAEPVATATPAVQPPAKVQAAAVEPPAAPITARPAPQATAKISAPAASESHAVATPAAPASVAALAESPPATETVAPAGDSVTADTATDNPAPAPKAAAIPAAKKLPATATAAPARKQTARNDGLAPILRRLFSAN